MKFRIEDEAGSGMETLNTYEEAIRQVEAYEAEDKADGVYERGFYYIRNLETGECERVVNID